MIWLVVTSVFLLVCPSESFSLSGGNSFLSGMRKRRLPRPSGADAQPSPVTQLGGKWPERSPRYKDIDPLYQMSERTKEIELYDKHEQWGFKGPPKKKTPEESPMPLSVNPKAAQKPSTCYNKKRKKLQRFSPTMRYLANTATKPRKLYSKIPNPRKQLAEEGLPRWKVEQARKMIFSVLRLRFSQKIWHRNDMPWPKHAIEIVKVWNKIRPQNAVDLEEIVNDICYLDKDGKIVEIKENVPPYDGQLGPMNPGPYFSPRFVVATMPGLAKEKKWKVGERPSFLNDDLMEQHFDNPFSHPKCMRAPVLDKQDMVYRLVPKRKKFKWLYEKEDAKKEPLKLPQYD
uniref:Uncharacterized protein n=1 Tax=Chromera velia CCMP2878 TaxID=1169474 RepID=A0A0G4GQ93_9ALVE|mmetsp:Transcript_28984/g.56734  ORF Transcript_28984/g.56734 Transcript_28984/m.56734 type:complete len:344 (+) Transcript_28984:222-1253(+)|eukprot:Cvel_22852.t1-p1 / transcript=Cvel_22852.t1 / gene=Cvel_22852 / organism=Chromera_velia_CCMP2878 / gene_product=hypothetical protein / transcript_product=hypothetical protein / location=Cvel_scaffold2292:1166-2194(-) / protein_length=343 / sequence_SO=supercontig / SO=protein_coding / is_pseudo=false